MVCIKDAYPIGSEPNESIIYRDISRKCGKYRRTSRLMRHIFALQKSPKITLHLQHRMIKLLLKLDINMHIFFYVCVTACLRYNSIKDQLDATITIY
jgi:hypothetical protein